MHYSCNQELAVPYVISVITGMIQIFNICFFFWPDGSSLTVDEGNKVSDDNLFLFSVFVRAAGYISLSFTLCLYACVYI